MQIHVVDHALVQQADRVAGNGVAKPGMKFLGHRGAADHAAALAHRNTHAGARQVEGADESVMAAADDDRCV